jgi:hypothetical protein
VGEGFSQGFAFGGFERSEGERLGTGAGAGGDVERAVVCPSRAVDRDRRRFRVGEAGVGGAVEEFA